jgi:hypothetical protein
MDQTDPEALAPTHGRTRHSDRRRIHPVIFDVPVRVYGRVLTKPSFYKEALVLFANAHGGLLRLNEPVCDGQTLLLNNALTMKDQACRVTYVHDRGGGKIEIGFEFSNLAHDFWQDNQTIHGSKERSRIRTSGLNSTTS